MNFVLPLLKHHYFAYLDYVFVIFETLDLPIGHAGSAEQEGIKVNIIELRHFVDFIRQNKLQTEIFNIGSNQCKLELSYILFA